KADQRPHLVVVEGLPGRVPPHPPRRQRLVPGAQGRPLAARPLGGGQAPAQPPRHVQRPPAAGGQLPVQHPPPAPAPHPAQPPPPHNSRLPPRQSEWAMVCGRRASAASRPSRPAPPPPPSPRAGAARRGPPASRNPGHSRR